jgi:acetoin utilization deacetylase AcuC-like enzyme
LMDAAKELCEGRVLFVLEGGYDLSGLTNSTKAVILQLRKTPLYVQDYMETPSSAVQQTVEQVKQALRPCWGDF